MFEHMIESIEDEVAKFVMKAEIESNLEREEVVQGALNNFFAFQIAFNLGLHDEFRNLVLNGLNHVLKHSETFHLVFTQRICLRIGNSS